MRYEMTDEQLRKLLDASKPVPYMIFGGMLPRTPQQNSNAAWQALGQEMGFKWDTVRPIPGENQRIFDAEPLIPKKTLDV